MTAASRARAIAAAIAALAVTMAVAGFMIPARNGAAQRRPAPVWGSHPIVRTSLPGGTSSPGGTSTPALTAITSTGSLNWAGYAVNRRRTLFKSVRATFFVPYLDCSQSPGPALSSHWVGLDGFVGTADSVEQGGIAANCSAKGKASYFAWYEMFPRPQARVRIGIHAGDSVTATVSYAKGSFRITLTDNTRGERLTIVRRCPDIKIGKRRLTCPRTSAEVISEAPASSTGHHLVIAQLADYGAVGFAGIAIVDGTNRTGGLVSSHWNTTRITQVRSSAGIIVARPTPTQAAMFDDYWQREG
jgi:hypothetical protein